MNTKSVLTALINSIFTTNGNKEITGQKTRETLVTVLNSTYLPAGFPSDWFGSSSTVPEGWHICDGTSFNISDYEDLFNALGGYLSPYGVNTSAGTFQIPNIPEGSSMVQCGNNSGYTLGSKGGSKTHTLTTDEMPAHTHSDRHLSSLSGSSSGYGANTGTLDTALKTGSTGGGSAHNNMPPYIAVNKIIKLY